MATASILRIGPSENSLSANILTKALVSYFHDHQPLDEPRVNSDAIAAASDTTSINTESYLRLQNKYFTATILLKDINDKVDNDDNNYSASVVTKEDGVILVFDALQSNPDRTPTGGDSIITFDSLTVTHEQAELNKTCGDLLRLCVGVSIGEYSPEELRGISNSEKEYSRRILWCLDRGYEYVEADLSQEGQAKGHDQRDKDGFARIVEAIQGTVWSSAVVGSVKSQELKASYVHDKEAIQQTTVSALEEEKEETEENLYQPPDPSLFHQPQTMASENSNRKDTDHDEIEAAAAATTLLDLKEVKASDMAQLREDLEAEKIFDKMEGLLKEANQIREASKNGTMSDNERRERAGEAALALVNLMGQFGMDDDDELEASDSDDSRVDLVDSKS